MKKRYLALLLCTALPLSGCSLSLASSSSASLPSSSSSSVLISSPDSSQSSMASSSAASSVVSSSSSASSSSASSLDFSSFWDYRADLQLSFSFSNAALYALSHYGAIDNQKWGDVYFPADLSIVTRGMTFSFPEVGVRMRGNTSRQEFCNEDGTIYRFSHLKVSFKATFDDPVLYGLSQFQAFQHDWSADASGKKARKKRNFLGMEKFDLKYLPRNDFNGTLMTYSQEIYVYDRFRQAGIMAPNAKWSAVTLTDQKMSSSSSFEIIEDIDDTFLSRRTSDSEGDLYKCVWGAPQGSNNFTGANLARTDAVTLAVDASGYDVGVRVPYGRIGVEDNYAGYHPNYQLKTNDNGESSDFSRLANYINVMHTCRYAKGTLEMLYDVLDVDKFLTLEAISFLFGNFDDQRNNANNYYLYFGKDSTKADYIPYDWDWCLGADCGKGSASWLPLRTGDIDNKEIVTNVYWDTFLTGSSSSPSYDVSSMQATYLALVKSYLDAGYLDTSSYAAFLTLQNNACSKNDLASVSAYMDAKKATLVHYFKS